MADGGVVRSISSRDGRTRLNTYVLDGDVAHITTDRGYDVLLDTDFVLIASRYFWRVDAAKVHKYVLTNVLRHDGVPTGYALHQMVVQANPGMVIDHINHDTLDNRRSNLRVVTQQENMQNRHGADRDSSTGIRGVRVATGPGRNGERKYRYYFASAVMHGKRHSKNFPYTDQGLADATAWAEAKRREIMPAYFPPQVS